MENRERKACICVGRNKNCMFCQGCGYVAGGLKKPTAAPSYAIKPVVNKQKDLTAGLRHCGLCKVSFKSVGDFKKHQAEVHKKTRRK